MSAGAAVGRPLLFREIWTMTGKNKKLVSLAGMLILAGLMAVFVRQAFQDAPSYQDTPIYVFDKNSGPAIAENNESEKEIDAIKAYDPAAETPETASKESAVIKDLFSRIIVGSGTTLRYFKWLGHECRKAASEEEHLALVRERIFSRFPPEEARQLFDTYRRYLACEMEAAKLSRRFGRISSVEEGLLLLREIQAYRRENLGKDLADRLYGEQVKESEYSIRRAAIIRDNTLYAMEKQDQLRRLDQDMWGETLETENDLSNADAYARYRDALSLHQKDLDEITSEADRQAYINDLRGQYFPPDAVARIKAAREQQDREQQTEQDYDDRKRQIANNMDLSEEQKTQEIDRLRQETFGDQAEAMKRRETIESARTARIRQSDSNSDAGP